MKFHVPSRERGVTFNFGFPAGKNVTIKSVKIFHASFARSVFINNLLGRPINNLNFYFCKS